MREKNIRETEEIHINQIVREIKKNKILIFSVFFVFFLIGFFLSFKNDKLSNLEVSLERKVIYPKYFNENQQNAIFNDFLILLLSKDNFFNFIEQSEQSRPFKEWMKKNNYDTRYYFKNNISYANFFNDSEINKYKNLNVRINFKYPNSLSKYKILDQYVEYSAEILSVELQKKVISIIDDKINIYQNALNLAKEAKLEWPINANNLTEDSYLNGSKVLQAKVNLFNQELIFHKANKMSYNPVLDRSFESKISNYKKISSYLLTCFFLSFLICFSIVFSKLINSKKK